MPNKGGRSRASHLGDYFYLEALMRVTRVWSPYW
jgi:unsaturated chondroitin disaccharide hydrolase